MAWFSEQVNDRRALDEESLQDAYAKLAASVSKCSGVTPRFSVNEAEAVDVAIAQIMAYYRLQPGEVPEGVDVSERLDYLLRPPGVMTRPVRLVDNWWHTITGAYMGRLKKEQIPVAILPAGIHGYAYVDPTTKKKVIINKRTSQELEEDALCLYRPLPQGSMTAADAVSFMVRSLGIFDYVIIVVATLTATLVGTITTAATKLLFGSVIPSGSIRLILSIAILFVGMTVSQALFNLISSLLTSRIEGKFRLQMEAAVYARVLLLQPSFFREHAPGEVTSRVLAIPSIASSLSKAIFELSLTCLMSLVYILQIQRYTPELELPALVTLVIEIVAAAIALRLLETYNHEEMEAKAKLSGVTPEVLRAIQKIKLAGAEYRAFAYWADSYAKASHATYGRPILILAAPALIPLISSVGMVVIYTIAAGCGIAADDFMAFNYAFGAASGAVGALVASMSVMAKIAPQLKQLEPLLEAPTESLGNKKQVVSIDGSIDVHNLSFTYDKDLPFVLDNISLSIQPGEYVAIVGDTGCGKSTLMRLLLGFEPPTRGSIQYGSYDLASVDVRSLRRKIGVVMQSETLFSGDLLSNIIVSNPGATIDDAWEAAELACIAEDIRKMPMRMHTLVGANGGGFSGGQKQRIMIARAVCGKPQVLMLDEATSALDNVVQKQVSDALARLSCTRVVIAHRLSTIKACDRIIVLDGGHIVEEGTYDELLTRQGVFAKLVESQRIEGED